MCTTDHLITGSTINISLLVACLLKSTFLGNFDNFKISFPVTLDYNITNRHLLLGRSNQSHYSWHHVKGHLGCSVLPKGTSSCRVQGSRIKDFQITTAITPHVTSKLWGGLRNINLKQAQTKSRNLRATLHLQGADVVHTTLHDVLAGWGKFKTFSLEILLVINCYLQRRNKMYVQVFLTSTD